MVIDFEKQETKNFTPNFAPLEVFLETKLSQNFKGVVDHKKEGDNIHLLTLFSLHHKNVMFEKAPQNGLLPIDDLVPNFKLFSFRVLNEAYHELLSRVQYFGNVKVCDRN